MQTQEIKFSEEFKTYTRSWRFWKHILWFPFVLLISLHFILEMLNENNDLIFRILDGIFGLFFVFLVIVFLIAIYKSIKDFMDPKVKIWYAYLENVEERTIGYKKRYYLVYNFENETHTESIPCNIKKQIEPYVKNSAKLYFAYYTGKLLKIEVPEKNFACSLMT